MYRFMTYFRNVCLKAEPRRDGMSDWHSKGEWEAWDRALHPRAKNREH